MRLEQVKYTAMAKVKIKAVARHEITCDNQLVVEKDTPVVITHIESTPNGETLVTIRYKRKRTTTYFGMLNINNFHIDKNE